MTYLKRQKVPKSWPIPRKGTAYVVRAHDFRKGLPVLVILRDVLEIVQNRNELKKAINLKQILVNHRPVTDEKKSVLLSDIITLVPTKQHFRMEIAKNGKFEVKEINEKEAGSKVSKIVDKKILKGKKTQLNLGDGSNFLTEMPCEVNDSVLIDLKNRGIEKCIPLKEGRRAIIFEGKHAGKTGIIQKIKKEKKNAEIELNGKLVNVLIKQFMVVE